VFRRGKRIIDTSPHQDSTTVNTHSLTRSRFASGCTACRQRVRVNPMGLPGGLGLTLNPTALGSTTRYRRGLTR